MERENRYIVIKRSDAKKYLSELGQNQLKELAGIINIERAQEKGKALKCVVVEEDWPEYESTWQAIEKRVDATDK